MKAFVNVNARDARDAAALARSAMRDGGTAAFSGGGTDLLQQIKDQVVEPDLVVNLRTAGDMAGIVQEGDGSTLIGGRVTLDALARSPNVSATYPVLSEAAMSVGTPQIRNVGTVAGNLCQRPWCWYYRNGFPCFKAGGSTCYSVGGENQLHAIFGGGPSFIVHPSDLAPALVALDAAVRIVDPETDRWLPLAEFFTLPRAGRVDRENVLDDGELLAQIRVPAARPGSRSAYAKVMDREAWTHAVVSAAVVLQMDGDVCTDARIVLGGVAPVPWRVPHAEEILRGRVVSAELASAAGEASIEGATPLSGNAYKLPLTRALVERTVLELGQVA